MSIGLSENKKDHIDFADGLEILVRHERFFGPVGKHFGDLIGTGIQLFSLGGGLVRKILFRVLEEYHRKKGYYVVETPIVAPVELYKISGHIEFYRENMYIFNIDEHEFALKPMNCPWHILIVANLLEKYRKVPMPFKIFELGIVHRYESSGNLRGLLRVRGFTQDDAHIFVEPKDAEREILNRFEEMKEIYEKLFHINVNSESIKLRLSFYDPKELGKEYVGEKEEWEEAQEFFRKVAEKINKRYGIEYFEQEGEAAFYGPKFDVVANLGDIGEWQIGTIQFDFNLPRRFKLNELFREIMRLDKVYMIHRAYLGSIERFLGVYLEFRNGRLPFVSNPVQVVIISILSGKQNEKVLELSNKIYEELKKEEIRVSRIECSKTEVAGIIRKLESKIKPSIVVFIGDEEANENKISVRYYDQYEDKVKNLNMVNIGELYSIIDNLEKSIEELIDKKIRFYEDFSFMV